MRSSIGTRSQVTPSRFSATPLSDLLRWGDPKNFKYVWLDFDSATIKYSQSSLPAFTTSLYFPRLVADPNESTGIALVNLDSSEATLRFTAFDRNGSAINGSNITNPASRTLNAASQIPVMDGQVFGEGLASSRSVGWLKVESTVRRIAGFFL